MELVKQPDGGFAIFQEEAAGFTHMNLTEAGAKSRLVTEFGYTPENAAGVVKAASPAGWNRGVDRIRQIFSTPKDAHPCVVQALAKAFDQRMFHVRRMFGAVKEKSE